MVLPLFNLGSSRRGRSFSALSDKDDLHLVRHARAAAGPGHHHQAACAGAGFWGLEGRGRLASQKNHVLQKPIRVDEG